MVSYSCFNLTYYNIGKTLTDEEDEAMEDDNNLYHHHHLSSGSSSRAQHAERREMRALSLVVSPPTLHFNLHFNFPVCWISRLYAGFLDLFLN